MKKYLLIFLLFAGTARGLHAQYQPNMYESMFNSPPPGKGNGLFQFFYSNRLSVRMELSYASQINYLPNLDSLLQNTIQLLEPLKDSLKADGIVRRVDVVYWGSSPAIRIVEHPEYGNAYTIKDKELMQLKVNQDTVRMVVFTKRRMGDDAENGTGDGRLYPFAVTFWVNNIGDIAQVPPTRLSECMAVLRPKIERFTHWDKANSPEVKYQASFNMKTGRMFSPLNSYYIPSNERGFQPAVGFGLTAVRGAVAPFLEAGIEYAKSNNYFTNRFRLSLEGQYFFSRDADQKLQTFKNIFADFQYRQTPKPFADNKLHWIPNISLGYLVHREGEWYEKNTFRLGLPQVGGRNFSVTPQLVFNDFMKNISVGFRFCLNF